MFDKQTFKNYKSYYISQHVHVCYSDFYIGIISRMLDGLNRVVTPPAPGNKAAGLDTPLQCVFVRALAGYNGFFTTTGDVTER